MRYWTCTGIPRLRRIIWPKGKQALDPSHCLLFPDQSRYWSHAVLGCLHRLIAVEEWLAIKHASMPYVQESSLSYERPLAALDLFILEEQREGDVDDVSKPPESDECIKLTTIDIRSPKFLHRISASQPPTDR